MNISPFTIYLWGIADSLCTATAIFATVVVAAALGLSLACILVSSDDNFHPEDDKQAAFFAMLKRTRNTAWIASSVLLPMAVLMPNSKTVAAMVIAPAIAQSKAIQQDVPELYNAAVERLKESLKSPAK